jgi:dienelactone hydrolase
MRIPIREEGLVATFFCSKEGTPRPGVIFVGGSEGGLNEYMASLLASFGFSTLALAYFGIEHLPKRLAEIPLEYVETAIKWMESRGEVIPGWLGIHGTSKGSELALLSGSFFHQIKAVVSLSGGALSFAGIVPWSEEETLPPAWTFQQKPIPYAAPKNPVDIALECLRMSKAGKKGAVVKWYRHLASDPEIIKKATIPVERINGPVLFISGQDDGDVSHFSRIGMDRLTKHHHPYEYTHLTYSRGTHSIESPTFV